MPEIREGVTFTLEEAVKALIGSITKLDPVAVWTAPNFNLNLDGTTRTVALSWDKTTWSPLRDPSLSVPAFEPAAKLNG